MPYVSTRTVKTIKYSGGGGQPQVTTTTTMVDRDGNKTTSYGGDSSTDNINAGAPSATNAKYGTPRSALFKPAVSKGASSRDTPASAGAGKSKLNDIRSSGRLFEDPDFPAVNSSLFYSQAPPRRFEWKRPNEICSNPKFISDGASRFDVRQGELGDCWLLAAVASLSLNKELFDRVVPPDQHFSGENYCGAFRFQFWRFGEWREVVVDDRLPTYRDQLVFMHSIDANEFWSALLEKAYAKLVGSYEALKGGSTSEALEDFTGGVTEMFDMTKEIPNNLFSIMQQAFKRCSLMGCSIEADPRVVEAQLSNGLIRGHAYSVTDVRTVPVTMPGSGKKGKIPLVRVRNPWGNEAEWTGAWGDKSQEWSLISEQEKKEVGLTFDDDGEFWMSYQDFVKHFERLEICHLGPQSLEADQLGGKKKSRWEMCAENGEWKRRLNAGGCRNFLDTFWTNPQFRVTVTDADDEDDEEMGTLIIGLMQKDMRKRRKEGADMHTIGYAIYKLNNQGNTPLDVNFFKYNASAARSPSFVNTREVCGRHKLAPGHYCIVPSTFEPNQEAAFLVRMFSEKPNESGEIDEETGMVEPEPAESNGMVAPVPSQPKKPEANATPEDDAKIAALRETFTQVAGEDLEIDAYELQSILNAAFKRGINIQGYDVNPSNFKFDGFAIETAKSMVAMMDYDQSGKLGFDEFRVLWTSLYLWKAAFKKFDKDRSGTMNSFELRQALNSVGFRLSNKILNSLVMRFSDKQGNVMFDDYILCCVRLKTIFETFKSQPRDGSGRALFEQDQFIQSIMYV